MTFIADFHIHSRYSRATSQDLCFEQLSAWGKRKGISLIGTGDCTHPGWLTEIREKLTPVGDGLLRLKDGVAAPPNIPPAAQEADIRFLLTGEISTIYKADDATRKVHHVVCLPGIEAAERFSMRLERIGNIASDGRPILGLDSRDLLEVLLECSPDAVLIPAHIWTPWFSVLGSKSGFNSIEACYRDLAHHIFALETGLSSDPPMNWMVSSLDRYTLVSNSDAHSPAKLGREANVFSCEMGYTAVMDALKRKTPGFWGTIEFFPEEGKYHFDGHRKCDFACGPEESRELDGKCPVCGGPLTLGVEYRVTELADRPKGTVPAGASQFKSLLSLAEILGELHETSASSKKVAQSYEKVLAEVGPELHVLMHADYDAIKAAGGELLALAIDKMRSGKVHATPGYDGEYGVITVFTDEERAQVIGQAQLFTGLSFGEKPKRALRKKQAPVDDPAAEAPPLDEGLSLEQAQAVRYPPSPLLIVAGPGAGKTRTLVERLACLVTEHAVNPAGILAITFSNRAAREMAERINGRLAALEVAHRTTVATFHKLGYTIIAEHAAALGMRTPVKILAEEEAEELFAAYEAENTIANLDDLERALATLYAEASGDIDQLYTLAQRAEHIAPAYSTRKRELGALDFTDLLLLPLSILAGNREIREAYQRRWAHVFVDEYQDVNVFQYLLLRLLCPAGSSLCAIGDPDQAIYGFRGADVRYFLRFQQDYPDAGQIALTRNYRSSRTIVKASSQVIAHDSLLGRRELWSHLPGPTVVEVATLPSPQAEAEYVVQTIEGLMGGISHFSVDSGRSGDGVGSNLGFNDVAILYRTHTLGEEVQQALERSGIPYQRAARKEVFQRADIRSTLALLGLAHNLGDRNCAVTLLKSGLPGITHAVCQQLMRRIQLPSRPVPVIPYLQQCELSPEEQQGVARLEEGVSMVSIIEGSATPVRAILQACFYFGISEEALGEAPWVAVLQRARHTDDLGAFLDSLRLDRDMDVYDPRAARVTLMTAHAAKGLEWEVVFIIGCEDGCFPHPASPLDEERRLFYVGMTRARQRLYLSYAEHRYQQGERQARNASSFIHDISTDLLQINRPFGDKPKRTRHTQLALTELLFGDL